MFSSYSFWYPHFLLVFPWRVIDFPGALRRTSGIAYTSSQGSVRRKLLSEVLAAGRDGMHDQHNAMADLVVSFLWQFHRILLASEPRQRNSGMMPGIRNELGYRTSERPIGRADVTTTDLSWVSEAVSGACWRLIFFRDLRQSLGSS